MAQAKEVHSSGRYKPADHGEHWQVLERKRGMVVGIAARHQPVPDYKCSDGNQAGTRGNPENARFGEGLRLSSCNNHPDSAK